MWKLVDGSLIHTTDVSRIKFRTNISESILATLKLMATENNTHVIAAVGGREPDPDPREVRVGQASP